MEPLWYDLTQHLQIINLLYLVGDEEQFPQLGHGLQVLDPPALVLWRWTG